MAALIMAAATAAQADREAARAGGLQARAVMGEAAVITGEALPLAPALTAASPVLRTERLTYQLYTAAVAEAAAELILHLVEAAEGEARAAAR